MTANELADLNEWSCCAHSKQVSAMLRQQAQKIENLLDQYQRLNENLEMWKTGHFKQQAEIEALKLRELTDQEIYKLWVIHCNDDISVFARAILKKASEK